MQIKVMTYNALRCFGKSPKKLFQFMKAYFGWNNTGDRILEEIKAADADIVCLQVLSLFAI